MKHDAITLESVRKAASRHQEVDPEILSLLPEDSQALTANAKRYIEFLLVQLDNRTRELSDFKEALEIYEKNCRDMMFRQNFGLCLTQIRAR